METPEIPKEVLDYRDRWYKRAENFRGRHLTKMDVQVASELLAGERTILMNLLEESEHYTRKVLLVIADVNSEAENALSEGFNKDGKGDVLMSLLQISLSVGLPVVATMVLSCIGVFIDGWGVVIMVLAALLAFKLIDDVGIRHITHLIQSKPDMRLESKDNLTKIK